MDLAYGKIELSKRDIQKLKCGHTLQSYNAVVLWRNNGIGMPSVTAASVSESDVIPCGISDHDAVYLIRDMCLPKRKGTSKLITAQTFKKFTPNRF